MKLLEQVKEAKTIGIGGHIRPDGDCVGSVMATLLYLSKELPQARIDAFLQKPAEIYNCIRGVDRINTSFTTEVENYDAFIALDTNKERLGDAERLFDQAVKTINIDHHISNKGTGEINIIRPEASSTCEVVYDVLDAGKIDREIAQALYVGIIHDTGVLKYSNTSPKTLRIAADLISYGFDFTRLIEETFYEKTYVQTQIMGRALLESFLFMEGKCIVSQVDRKTMAFYEAGPEDLEGIVSQLKNIKGVECAIFMYQLKPLEYKVSLRSGGRVDVAGVASFFGGGGHVRAAGCIVNGTFYDVVNNLAIHIERQLREKDEPI